MKCFNHGIIRVIKRNMCILGLARNVRSDYPFILVHNRDEFFDRSVSPPQQYGDVIYAKDNVGNGTWFGLNRRSGYVVAITNVRDKISPPDAAPSRGEIVSRLLQDDPSDSFSITHILKSYNSSATESSGKVVISLPGIYAGFNLIFGKVFSPSSEDDSQGYHFYLLSNRSADITLNPNEAILHQIAKEGINVLSNSSLDDLSWAKCHYLYESLELQAPRLPHPSSFATELECVQSVVARLSNIMSNQDEISMSSINWLPKYDTSTLTQSQEKYLQHHVFIPPINEKRYGTRSTSIVIKLESGAVYYLYKSFDPEIGIEDDLIRHQTYLDVSGSKWICIKVI
jgi:uncharacterized protein with NRDE domain